MFCLSAKGEVGMPSRCNICGGGRQAKGRAHSANSMFAWLGGKMNAIKMLLLSSLLIFPAQAFAAGEAGVDTNQLYNILLPYFVLAVVFEVALSPLFNWRIFLLHFEGKGFKTPISIVLAYVTFSAAGLDVFGELLKALGHGYKPLSDGTVVSSTWWGQVLTAFLIAGGSSGINQIFAKLGIRTPELNKKKAAEARAEATRKKILEEAATASD